MSLTDIYNRAIYLCLPRQSRSPEWVEHVLHYLWDHGLDFVSFKLDGHQPLTWEEQLEATNIETETRETFRSYVGRLARAERLGLTGRSLRTSHVVGWPYLSFNFQKHLSLDWIVLSQDGLELEPYWERKREQYDTPIGYLAVFQAFLEWAKVLCEIVEPLFAFGYCEGYLTNFDHFYEYVNRQGEVPTQGHLPEIDNWFSHPPPRYIAPTLLTSELQSDLLSREHWQLERLKTGGIFVTPPDPEYTHIAYGGYCILNRSEQKHAVMEEGKVGTSIPQNLTHQNKAETQRALNTFSALDVRNGVRKAQAYLSSLETPPE